MQRRWWTLLAVSAGVFMLLLDITIVNVALPDIQRAFGSSLADLQWVIDAYALTLAALLLAAGSVADRIGRRVVFAAGVGVFTLGSLLCGLATNAPVLWAARAFQGVGGSLMYATSLALIASAFPAGKDRSVAFGVFGALNGGAVAIGPVIGGAITSGLGWRWIFLVNVPIGIATLAVTRRYVTESRNPRAGRLDWAGFVTFSSALVALVFGLIRSNADGWDSGTVVSCLVAAGVLLVAFTAIELRRPDPMFDFSLLRVPTFNGGLIAAWAIAAGLFSAITYLILYLQNVLGYSALEAGLRFLPITGAIAVTSGVAGRLTSVVPVRLLIGSGFLLVAIGLLTMRGLTADSHWTHLLPGMLLAGAGAGLVNVPLSSTAVGVVSPERSGMASGINSTFRQIGTATGVALLGTILATQVRSSVTSNLADTPLADHAGAIAARVASGDVAGSSASAPPGMQHLLADVARTGFVDGLNAILLVGAVVAFGAAALTLALVRRRDFVEAADADPVTVPV